MMRCIYQNRHAHLMMGEWSAPLRTAAGQLRPGQTAAQDIPTHPGPDDVRVTSSHHGTLSLLMLNRGIIFGSSVLNFLCL